MTAKYLVSIHSHWKGITTLTSNYLVSIHSDWKEAYRVEQMRVEDGVPCWLARTWVNAHSTGAERGGSKAKNPRGMHTHDLVLCLTCVGVPRRSPSGESLTKPLALPAQPGGRYKVPDDRGAFAGTLHFRR